VHDARAGSNGGPALASRRNPFLLVLAYLWPMSIVMLLVEREDTELRWHAAHGLVLQIAEILAYLGFLVAVNVISVVVPASALEVLKPVAQIAIVFLHAAAAWDAVHGRRLLIPGISIYADRVLRAERPAVS
jgi:uncharacterized membrane protein